MRRLALLLTIAVVVFSCARRPPQNAWSAARPRIVERIREADYLGAWVILDALPAEWGQAVSHVQTFLGDHAGAVKRANTGDRRHPPLDEEAAKTFVAAVTPESPAHEAVCRAVAGRRVLIVNERHHQSQHRAFGRQLLSCLRAQGFTHLALETLNQGDAATLATRGHVARNVTGFYADDPAYARMVDEALELGFKPVAYEHAGVCPDCEVLARIDAREEGQSRNLAAFLRATPGARLVVWVGMSHAYKRQLEADVRTRWMAARLWEKTGIEPYVVEQLSEEFESAAWIQPTFLAVNRFVPGDQSVFVDVSTPATWSAITEPFRASLRKTETDGPPAIDAVVVHRRRAATDPRHTWLLAPRESSRPIKPPPCTGRALVQLWQDSEARAKGRVPLDQSLCACGSTCEVLSESGPRWMIIWGDGGAILFEGVIPPSG